MPIKPFLQKSAFLILYCTCLLLSPCIRAKTALADDIIWLNIETKHTIICYQSLKDLTKFNNKVDYSPDAGSLRWIFTGSDGNPFTERIKNKVDILYERVKEILGMYKGMEKVFIHVFRDQGQLHTAYYDIYGRETRLRAWYIFERNTIYINVNDLHEGILAHEMAHAIIDNYLTVRPPTASAEILARYVDEHLVQ
jgi:hypothetical protein